MQKEKPHMISLLEEERERERERRGKEGESEREGGRGDRTNKRKSD